MAIDTRDESPMAQPAEVRIRLRGEFDVFRAEELAFTLRQAEAAKVVVLDLAETTFLDAAALTAL